MPVHESPFQNELFAGKIKNDFELPQHAHPDVPRERVGHGRAFDEEIGLRPIDGEPAKPEFSDVAAAGAGAAAHAELRAVASLGRREQLVFLDKRVAEAKSAVAARINFELALDRGPIRSEE